MTWSFRPLGITETVVVVESAALDDWRPLGKLDGKKGNSIDLTAKLVEKGTENPPQGARVVGWSWDFTAVSREPGVLMNYPRRADAETKPDLRFELNPGFQLDAEGQHATALPAPTLGTQSTITVGSYDWGGFGAVKVTCVLADGKQYVGYLKTDPAQTEIRLPKRHPGNFIAEAWKKELSGKADNADDEDDPIGDGNKGDGLTLYQEYRGFVENGRRIEGDPLKKDYFINMRNGDGFMRGIVLFIRLSGLKVHYRIGGDEMEDDRVINRNYDQGPRVVDQHAVWVRVREDGDASGRALGGPGTPGMIHAVWMPLTTSVTYEDALLGEGQENYRNSMLAHELLHACNVWHHSDTPRNDYDTVWLRQAGTENVFEDGQPIDVLWESGENINAQMPLQSKKHIGGFQGHCSGVQSCVMRYDNCTAYIPRLRPGIRYRAEEQWGNSLCVTAQGTGTNEVGRTPQSRYGPAADGRGECKMQILVNDAVRAPRR